MPSTEFALFLFTGGMLGMMSAGIFRVAARVIDTTTLRARDARHITACQHAYPAVLGTSLLLTAIGALRLAAPLVT